MQRFARDPRWRLEGQLGFLAILHTWTQRLKLHFHVHCIVPGGVWRADKKRWKPCRGKWLFRKQSLADALRNRYLKHLRALRRRGKLRYVGRAARFEDEAFWEALLGKLEQTQWIVFPKPVPGDAAHALDYVARYTHKVAIGDHRIKALENGPWRDVADGEGGRVTYTWRDRSAGNIEKTDTLPVEEFTRRFLSHILPDGFHKVRYFGWMAAMQRKTRLAEIRAALGVEPPAKTDKEPFVERIRRETGVDITLCPHCRQGHIQRTDRQIPPRSQSP